MSGFNYEVNIKQYSAGEIKSDVDKWQPEVIKAAFIMLAAAFFSENWPELKTNIEREIKDAKN